MIFFTGNADEVSLEYINYICLYCDIPQIILYFVRQTIVAL